MAWTPPGPGEFNAKIRFDRRAASGQNRGGHVKAAYAEVCTRSGRLLPLKGGEDVQAGRLAGVAAYSLDIRQDSTTRGLTTDDRAVDARDPSRVFAVRSILDLEGRGQWWTLTIEQGALPDGKG
jgi:hypothetical protein